MTTSIFDRPEFSAALFYPDARTSPAPPNAEDHGVAVDGGVRLHLRAHNAQRASRALLLFHGNGEVVADYDGLAQTWLDAVGVAFAVVDYRGYGASGGTPSLRAQLGDAPAVLAYARALFGERPLVVMGRSLGSLSAAALCADTSSPAAGFVFESAISNLQGLVDRRRLPSPSPLTDDDRETFDPLRRYARCEAPALVLHGARDALIVPAEAEATFAALNTERKTLCWVPGRGHNDLSSEPVYWRALRTFVDDACGGAPPGG